MDFQRWNAAFTSCVDMTSLSPQFKMLRLEACLAGEAANTIKGLGYSLSLRDNMHRHSRRFTRSYFSDKNGKGNQKCCVCTGNQVLLQCEAFQKLPVDERWQIVKRFGLCFRCLADNHHGKPCPRSKQCGINGYTGTHQNIRRHLLNFVCDQKQNRTFKLRPRPFSQRPTQMRDREKPWRGMVPGNPLL